MSERLAVAPSGNVGAGGTFDTAGLLFVNRCSWAHVLRATARVAGVDEGVYLDEAERAALDGRRNPTGVIVPPRFR